MTPNLIILEGPDGAGKSTLAAALGARLGREVRHHGPYLGEAEIAARYFADVADVLGGMPLIVDRSWPSEPIYGAVHRGGIDRVGVNGRRVLERGALAAGAVLVRCLPPLGRCLATWRARRGDEYLRGEAQLRAVHTAYLDLRSAVPVVDFDYTADSADDLPARLEAAAWPNPGPGAGAWRPGESVLLVGERPNTARAGDLKHRLPFASVHPGGCSAWLADRLEEAGVGEERLYWVNAYDVTGRRTDPAFIAGLAPRAVVALGRHAHAWCLDAGVDEACLSWVTHPQHHKRFYFNRPYPLVSLLKELCP
jgi:hypothetical protein